MKTVTLRCSVIDKQTEKAIHINYFHSQDNYAIIDWLPKSQVIIRELEVMPEYSIGLTEQIYKSQLDLATQSGWKICDIEIPEWLCREKINQLFNPKYHYAK